ncbi:MAG: AAA family ATPase, partial [Rhodanobacteraceae bacterium]
MSVYSFNRWESATDAEAWRAIDRALARWVRAHGGSETLAGVAAWTSLADGQGDSALPLLGDDAGRHGMPSLDAATVDTLRAETMVGNGESSKPTPFVLDGDGRFALWRNHAHEVRIAEHIRARRAVVRDVASTFPAEDINALFKDDRSPAVQSQREAVAGVAGRRLFLLTGGPGTGKTTTVLRMLLALQRCEKRMLDIAVAAPTGKAAQRLVQSLRAGKETLLAGNAAPWSGIWRSLLASIPDEDALTVHRLLGYDPRRNVFTRGAARPLAADIVVVDEASMLDLGMLRALLDATRPDATLILVGDADQLTSVATGSVLMDLVGALEEARAPELVRLEHSFRSEQPLIEINRAVRAGDSVALERAFTGAGKRAQRVDVDTTANLRAQLDGWAG